ncbi:hypothetical protein PCE1_000213 [Barthelona sp. PCE]
MRKWRHASGTVYLNSDLYSSVDGSYQLKYPGFQLKNPEFSRIELHGGYFHVKEGVALAKIDYFDIRSYFNFYGDIEVRHMQVYSGMKINHFSSNLDIGMPIPHRLDRLPVMTVDNFIKTDTSTVYLYYVDIIVADELQVNYGLVFYAASMTNLGIYDARWYNILYHSNDANYLNGRKPGVFINNGTVIRDSKSNSYCSVTFDMFFINHGLVKLVTGSGSSGCHSSHPPILRLGYGGINYGTFEIQNGYEVNYFRDYSTSPGGVKYDEFVNMPGGFMNITGVHRVYKKNFINLGSMTFGTNYIYMNNYGSFNLPPYHFVETNNGLERFEATPVVSSNYTQFYCDNSHSRLDLFDNDFVLEKMNSYYCAVTFSGNLTLAQNELWGGVFHGYGQAKLHFGEYMKFATSATLYLKGSMEVIIDHHLDHHRGNIDCYPDADHSIRMINNGLIGANTSHVVSLNQYNHRCLFENRGYFVSEGANNRYNVNWDYIDVSYDYAGAGIAVFVGDIRFSSKSYFNKNRFMVRDGASFIFAGEVFFNDIFMDGAGEYIDFESGVIVKLYDSIVNVVLNVLSGAHVYCEKTFVRGYPHIASGGHLHMLPGSFFNMFPLSLISGAHLHFHGVDSNSNGEIEKYRIPSLAITGSANLIVHNNAHLEILNGMAITGAYLRGNGTIDVSGDSTLSSNHLYMYNSDLRFENMVWTSYHIYGYQDAKMTIKNGGVFSRACTSNYYFTLSSGVSSTLVIEEGAIFEFSAFSSTFYMHWILQNHGLFLHDRPTTAKTNFYMYAYDGRDYRYPRGYSTGRFVLRDMNFYVVNRGFSLGKGVTFDFTNTTFYLRGLIQLIDIPEFSFNITSKIQLNGDARLHLFNTFLVNSTYGNSDGQGGILYSAGYSGVKDDCHIYGFQYGYVYNGTFEYNINDSYNYPRHWYGIESRQRPAIYVPASVDSSWYHKDLYGLDLIVDGKLVMLESIYLRGYNSRYGRLVLNGWMSMYHHLHCPEGIDTGDIIINKGAKLVKVSGGGSNRHHDCVTYNYGTIEQQAYQDYSSRPHTMHNFGLWDSSACPYWTYMNTINNFGHMYVGEAMSAGRFNMHGTVENKKNMRSDTQAGHIYASKFSKWKINIYSSDYPWYIQNSYLYISGRLYYNHTDMSSLPTSNVNWYHIRGGNALQKAKQMG